MLVINVVLFYYNLEKEVIKIMIQFLYLVYFLLCLYYRFRCYSSVIGGRKGGLPHRVGRVFRSVSFYLWLIVENEISSLVFLPKLYLAKWKAGRMSLFNLVSPFLCILAQIKLFVLNKVFLNFVIGNLYVRSTKTSGKRKHRLIPSNEI